MILGLKRGTVKLFEHQKEWEIEAQNTILRLKKILGDGAKDIQHVGSTAIPVIKAKPIIDIAVAVNNFNDVLAFENQLKAEGFYYRPQAEQNEQLLFASGSFYEGTEDLQTHFIHVVLVDSMEWINYINFRDYLNDNPAVAKKYEDLKVSLALQNTFDGGREKYTKGKHDFIVRALRNASDNTCFYNVKQILTNDNILELLAPSVYKPTKEKLLNRALKYQQNDNTHIYAYKDSEYKGIVVFEIADNSATICDIAVKPEYQNRGIGSKIIDFIFNSFNVDSIIAETDDDAIGFYKKYGFDIVKTEMKFDTKRYICLCKRTLKFK